MAKRDFLAVTDLTRDEILRLFDLAGRMKAGSYRDTPLAGKTLAMIFAKSSTRTRVSFEVGTYQLGGQALFLSSRDIQIGRGEPIPDTARVLSRYVDGIMIRTFDHAEVLELARHASIPVINGLTDLSHPCQVLADVFTVREALGTWEGKRIAWVGDGNNMANSWIEAAQVLGFELRLACPEGYEPNRAMFERAKAAGACLSITEVPEEAVEGAHVVNTDVWASMGQEEEAESRRNAFRGYEMPVSYPAGIAAEHRAVREHVGVFDVSHMGEFEVSGPDRNAFVQRVTCNDVGALKPGQAQYSALLTDQGTFVDDCLVYRFEDRLMLVVNAANIATDWAHIVAQKRGANVRLEAGYPLYGSDIDAAVTPYEAGLRWIVKLEKGADFTGLAALKQQKLAGVKRRLVGFKVTEPKIVARHGFGVYLDGPQVDVVRSGTVTPTVNRAIGMTYLPAAEAKPGTR